MKPNLFTFATRELSQDAILCWLLSWADPIHATASPELHAVGQELVGLIFDCAGQRRPTIDSIAVERQKESIDIFCTINGRLALLVEDKVGTQHHSNQLSRYLEQVREWGYASEDTVAAYVQTGDQDDYSEVLAVGYCIVKRSDLLELFENVHGRRGTAESDILADFARHLRATENEVLSYRSLPLSDWVWASWKGFYAQLQGEFGQGGWDYVPNQSGGFLAFPWGTDWSHDVCNPYLQLEHDRLCFKIQVHEPKRFRELRWEWHERILAICRVRGLHVVKPPRFGHGYTMTVAVLDGDYRVAGSDGAIDMKATVGLLRRVDEAFQVALANDAFAVNN
jgi:hypothetical protein